jgi:hypothetical protein
MATRRAGCGSGNFAGQLLSLHVQVGRRPIMDGYSCIINHNAIGALGKSFSFRATLQV